MCLITEVGGETVRRYLVLPAGEVFAGAVKVDSVSAGTFLQVREGYHVIDLPTVVTKLPVELNEEPEADEAGGDCLEIDTDDHGLSGGEDGSGSENDKSDGDGSGSENGNSDGDGSRSENDNSDADASGSANDNSDADGSGSANGNSDGDGSGSGENSERGREDEAGPSVNANGGGDKARCPPPDPVKEQESSSKGASVDTFNVLHSDMKSWANRLKSSLGRSRRGLGKATTESELLEAWKQCGKTEGDFGVTSRRELSAGSEEVRNLLAANAANGYVPEKRKRSASSESREDAVKVVCYRVRMKLPVNIQGKTRNLGVFAGRLIGVICHL